MRKTSTLIAALLLCTVGINGQLPSEPGFEERFDSLFKTENVRDWIQFMSARPHHVGSPYGKEVAEFIADKFRSWGYQTEIEEYQVLFPTPRVRLVEMVSPTKFTAKLEEASLAEDSTSGQKSEQLPNYNAYSADGDVTGELVYVNYGVPADYEELTRRGIDVRGKIVIARYGGSWRGIKPKVAAENGALGCILYSDPRDDGYFRGPDYPEGPFRNESGAQRGSVADMPTYPGDPLTPGRGAVADAERLSLEEAPTLTKIPVLPISYADALPLLKAMSGPVAPQWWRGALPITYRLGPGPARVHMKLEFNWDLKPAYNVIGRIVGSERPDEWIMRGNHHDAWVNGAQDPVSGMAATMEEARVLGQLVREGWRPKRTILYAGWDAEEPGLLGSTEWAEHHAEELQEKLVVYINSDSNSRGFLSMGGSHSLESFINSVAKRVKDPQTGVTVWERARARRLAGASPKVAASIRDRGELTISALGSGSDYTPFLQHLGIASLNIGFGGEGAGGSYHSIFDSFDHYSRFGDPTFEYGVALGQTAGRAVIQLASDPVLPFRFTNFANTVATYQQEVIELADQMRAETLERNRQIEDGSFRLAADPKLRWQVPEKKSLVPFINFAPLQNAVSELKMAAAAVDNAIRESAMQLSASQQKKLDAILMKTEQSLTNSAGLSRRPWYVHHIYAPGFYTGYGVKTLPGVREALEQRDWPEAGKQIERVAKLLTNYSDQLRRATAILTN